MVLIPGTQPEAPDTNPFDIPGVGEALGYDSEEVVPAIGQALREAGAQAGEQVVAVGHSQGGAHAMNLSRNKAFLSEFDLRYVLTAGAPAGGISSEPGIAALHLEHVQDWVPGSDGRVNPDTKDRVTVTLNNDVKTPEGEDPGLGPGHRLENYAAGAELVAASRDTSLAASTAAFAGVVGVGGAARVTHFKLERSPLPDKRPGLRNPDLPETRSVAGAR
jgi:pimeloyl-ACP methyl ester carboxylesterase